MAVYARTAGGTVVERVRPVEGSHLARHYADLAARGVGGWRVEDAAPAVAASTAPPEPAEQVGDLPPTPDDLPADEPVDEAPSTRRGRGRASIKVSNPAPEG